MNVFHLYSVQVFPHSFLASSHGLYFENVPLYTSLCIKHILFFTYAPIYIKDAFEKNVTQNNKLHSVRQENTAICAN